MEFFEVVPKLIPELVFRHLVFHTRITAELLVELVGLNKGDPVLRFEDVIIGLDVVEENIRLEHHLRCHIVRVVGLPHLQICLETVMGDRTKLKPDLGHQCGISMGTQRLTRRLNINQSSNDTRFCICDLHRLVRTHDEERIDP